MGRRKEVIINDNGRYVGKHLDDSTCLKLESLMRLSEENGYVEDLRNVIFDLSASDIELIKEMKTNDMVDLQKGKLTNLQTIGVAYMYFAKRLVLGDSVGLGKTVEVCGLCNLLEATMAKEGLDFRFLLLTEKTSAEQIRDKMIQFTGNYVDLVYGDKGSVQKFSDTYKEDDPYSVVAPHSLMNSIPFQEYIRYYMNEKGYNPFDILIIDEAGSVLTNSNTQIYKNAKFLEGIFDRVIILNATSFEKELAHFYNQINFIDDTLLPTKTEFSKQYEIMTYGRFPYPVPSGKYKNQEQFRHLVGYRYLKRTRRGAGAKMEDCSADVLVSDLSPTQKKLLKMVSMPAMVYDCPSYFNSVGYNIKTNVDTTPKLKDLLSLIDGELCDAKSILVYARYKEAQKAIKEELESRGITCAVMNGDTSAQDRSILINKFKLGDIRVLITNVQKSLDFGDCNYCIFYDYDPNPSNMVQFEGRMTRSFDIIGKHVYLLISRGKELKTFKEIVADRAQASDVFSGSDYSCVLSILLENDKLKELK